MSNESIMVFNLAVGLIKKTYYKWVNVFQNQNL